MTTIQEQKDIEGLQQFHGQGQGGRGARNDYDSRVNSHRRSAISSVPSPWAGRQTMNPDDQNGKTGPGEPGMVCEQLLGIFKTK